MAYKINNTFGTLLVTLADGTIDVATTDLTLIGKGYAGFGEKLNENLVKLLENFNNTSAPSNKIQGQLWFDQTNKILNVYDGTKFKPAGGPTNSTSQPTNAVLGDTWFDTANTQLYVYNGTAWTLIGPTTVAGSGVTQVVSEIASDNTGVNQSYLKLVANDAVVGVVSNVAFTPSSTETNATALDQCRFLKSWHRAYNYQRQWQVPNSGERPRLRRTGRSCGGQLSEIRPKRFHKQFVQHTE